MRPTSLLRRLLVGFMLVMLGIWLAALAHIVWQVKIDQARQTAIVNRAWTRQIMLNMQSLPSDPAALARIGRGIEALRLDMFREAGIETHARTRVWLGGQLAYDSAPGAPLDDGWVRWVERDAARGITVERREKPNVDWLFTLSAANYLFSPLVYSLPFVLLPAWLIVRVGLRPLRAVAQSLEARGAADLAPLPASPYRELAPVVDAVNSLMRRLSERLAREHEFLADAAHELKTPLSVVQINAHLLEAATDAAQRVDAGAGLREGVARATHTVHQLLAFERARQEPADAPPQDLDLAALLRERLALAAPLALRRGVDVELCADRPTILPLHRESMAALLDNVIGNAVKYSPDGARVDVRLDTDGATPCITVLDEGPGIPPALRGRVFERFYRMPGQDQAGSGLGLAIAERAAARNGACIVLDAGPDGRGLAVRIEFAGSRIRTAGNPASAH
jgi:two-component system sensor histidine kinase QseC